MDPDEVRQRLGPRTRLLVVVSPHNPTGVVQSPDVLRRLANLAVQHELVVVSDEIYEKILYDDLSHVSLAALPGLRERTITVNGFSKAYSMTGWRLGYAAAPPPFIQAMNRVHQYNVSCACAFAQAGAVAALTGPQDCVAAMVREFRRRRDLVVPALNDIPGLSCLRPGGAFYVWLNIQGRRMRSEDFALKLLETAYVSLVPGPVFGESGQGYVRLSYANSYERLAEAVERLRRFCA
jgi:aspartate/methionine/tyrosine aminotransferase